MIQFANKESLCFSFFPVWPKDMLGARSTPTCSPPPPPKFANRISRSPLHRPAGRIRTSHGKQGKSCVLLSLSLSLLPQIKDVSSPPTPLSWLLLAYDGVHLSLSLSLSLSCHSSCKPVFILVFGTLAKSSIYNEASKGAFLPSFPPVAKRFCVHC